MGYYTIAIIALLAAISPGPDFVVVAKNAMAHDRRHAILTSIGIGIGILVHAAYCVLGLAIVISHSLILFSTIKYLGAAYLIYLGIKSLLSKDGAALPKKNEIKASRSDWLAFRDGLLTNVLNPKCTLFMLSVFTLVVQPHTPTWTQIIYGLEIAIIAIVWFVFLSIGFTHHLIRSKIMRVQKAVTKVIGVALVALGVSIVFEAR